MRGQEHDLESQIRDEVIRRIYRPPFCCWRGRWTIRGAVVACLRVWDTFVPARRLADLLIGALLPGVAGLTRCGRSVRPSVFVLLHTTNT